MENRGRGIRRVNRMEGFLSGEVSKGLPIVATIGTLCIAVTNAPHIAY
jgi:hypothetical protein